MNTLIDALVLKYVRALPANSTDAVFTDPVDYPATLNTDVGGVSSVPQIILPPAGYDMAPFAPSAGHAALRIAPFAVGGAGVLFTIRVYGWSLVGGDWHTALWHPELMYEASCTTGNKTGLAGRIVDITEFYAATIAEIFGNPNVSCETLSPGTILPGDNNNGHICVDAKGSRIMSFQFRNDTSVSANALIRPF